MVFSSKKFPCQIANWFYLYTIMSLVERFKGRNPILLSA